jgi:hypothetical protein
MAWRLASLGLGSWLLWLRIWLALLVDAMGFPSLWVGLRRDSGVMSAASQRVARR